MGFELGRKIGGEMLRWRTFSTAHFIFSSRRAVGVVRRLASPRVWCAAVWFAAGVSKIVRLCFRHRGTKTKKRSVFCCFVFRIGLLFYFFPSETREGVPVGSACNRRHGRFPMCMPTPLLPHATVLFLREIFSHQIWYEVYFNL